MRRPRVLDGPCAAARGWPISTEAPRSRRGRRAEMSVRAEGRALIRAQRPDQASWRSQTTGEVTLRDPASKERARKGTSLRGAAVGRAPRKTFHRRDVLGVLLPQPDYINDKAGLERARLRKHLIGGP